ncbi:Plasmodium exported protein (Pm-fam-a like), unknown function [Plasmodium malariae]|uniref:Fam-m protein n=1 Tax=Plasmodium malariae TaxID=5858 RepID=A0A1A8X410_PLAMA|nr:Plasmodium exported protein (Pm-fam-a like), unknown function [Plasmodium malariae]
MDENYNIGRKINSRYYRLLGKCRQYNDLNNAWLKEKFPINGENKKKDASNNKSNATVKCKQFNISSLNKAQHYIEVIDFNNGTFDGKHFHFEKKWIKKKNYDKFLDKKRRICDIALKKIKFRNYGYGVAIFFLFVLLGLGLPIWRGLELSVQNLQNQRAGIFNSIITFITTMTGLDEGTIYVVLFVVVMIILAIIVIIAIYKILSNNERYKKIKLMTE